MNPQSICFRRLAVIVLALGWGALQTAVWDSPAAGRLVAAPVIQPAGADPYADESWQVIYLRDERIGYARTATSSFLRDGRRIIKTSTESQMTIKRLGQELVMRTRLETEETETGDLLVYTSETHNPPAASTLTSGRIEDGRLYIESTVAGRTTKTSQPWDAEVKSPGYQDRLLRASPLKPGHTYSFKVYVPEFSKTATVRLAADDHRFTELLDGKKHKLLQVRITQSTLPGITTLAFIDEQGDTLKSVMRVIGMPMTTYSVSAEEAMKEITGGELDVAINSLVRVDRIRNPHKTKRAVYRITTPGQDPLQLLVSGPTQEVKRIGPEQAELTVTALPLPDATRPSRADRQYTQPTQFLQSEDHRVVDHAIKAVGNEIIPSRIAAKMERYVQQKLKKKNFSTALASAAEVAKNLEGDCTEHAVLLAAMLRVRRVPSRVAVGLVYAPGLSAFIGHMWTEAYLGEEWIPLDATLGEGGIGAAHIKLAESSLADNAPVPATAFLPLFRILGNLKIEVVSYE